MRYLVIFQLVVGSNWEIAYSWDQEKFKAREEAIRHGFKTRGSDDFNVGVLRNGALVDFCWMDESLEYDLHEIGKQIGLRAARKGATK